RSLHQEPREFDRFPDVSDKCHGTGPRRSSIHDRGIHCVLALVAKNRAATSIQKRVIVKWYDRRCDRLERTAAAFADPPARFQSFLESAAIFLFEFAGHLRSEYRPGAAMDR